MCAAAGHGVDCPSVAHACARARPNMSAEGEKPHVVGREESLAQGRRMASVERGDYSDRCARGIDHPLAVYIYGRGAAAGAWRQR